ncbi:hypothetical protein [Caproicibacterium amylolyticum]|uniref:Uncharacterized protein n=1 Tax=Caproicibacterium amylolyticum TaxID=2766537 RepID=A0A7G9WF43_9FIRM|nr:hypothetical protein [Caproicibacterium amylolyticum]QNO17305.1 hypothetical protein H6X83_10150 [Caproicibacterium amylolyticum]
MITHDFSPFPAALAVQYNIDDIGKMFAGTFLIKKSFENLSIWVSFIVYAKIAPLLCSP